MFATGLILAMQLVAATPVVTVMEATIVVEPDSAVRRVFKFAPGDEILVTVEALKQELAESEKGDNDLGNAVVAMLSVLQTPKVGSVSLGPLDADPIAQAGDSQIVHLKCVTASGGPHWLAISGAHDGCRSTYRVTVRRRPAKESLRSYDTKLTPTSIDTVADPLLTKEIYLAAGTTQTVLFEIPKGAERIVLIVANKESYNVLTSGLASTLASVAVSAAFRTETKVDLSSFRTGKDFGYSAEAYSGTAKLWVPVAPWARTLCDYTVIKPSERKYTICRVQLDNSYSKFTSKTVKVAAYVLTLRPVYNLDGGSPRASSDTDRSDVGVTGNDKNAAGEKPKPVQQEGRYKVVVYANDKDLGEKVLGVLRTAGFTNEESHVTGDPNDDASIKYGAATKEDVKTMRKLVSAFYDGKLEEKAEFASDDSDVFINLP